MENIRKFLSEERNVRGLDRAQGLFNSFSITEKVFFLIAAIVFTWGAFSMLSEVNSRYLVDVPAHGGELSEGIVGTPRFINPLLAISDADRDLTALVYSGLLRATPYGEYITDLALRYTISPDGLSYTFVIRPDAEFHDGTPVTADDVIYTVTKAQDITLKSPRRVNWEGVTVEKIGERELTFKLKQPYAPFIANLTLGILPRHIWRNVEGDQFTFSVRNLDAIGSGPYEIDGIERDGDGIPREFRLVANDEYALGEPYIERLTLKFYQNEESLIDSIRNGTVESASNIGPEMAEKIPDNRSVLRAPFTRVFGVFFNQNEKELLASRDVRKALALAIDKEAIIANALYGYGTPVSGPLPIAAATTSSASPEAAAKLLEKAGWKKNAETGIYELKTRSSTEVLSFSLSTANIPELVESARVIEGSWKALGVSVDVRIFEPSDLNQSVIRPRKYDSLLFGIVTGRNPDLYPFWHSSQRNDPGLNIALYTNARVDKQLETMRSTTDPLKAEEALTAFEKEIASDTPAIFIWSPDFIYATPENLGGVELGEVTTPSDRFLSIHNWYTRKDKVWRVFANQRTVPESDQKTGTSEDEANI